MINKSLIKAMAIENMNAKNLKDKHPVDIAVESYEEGFNKAVQMMLKIVDKGLNIKEDEQKTN
jgi:hypothetical protein